MTLLCEDLGLFLAQECVGPQSILHKYSSSNLRELGGKMLGFFLLLLLFCSVARIVYILFTVFFSIIMCMCGRVHAWVCIGR